MAHRPRDLDDDHEASGAQGRQWELIEGDIAQLHQARSPLWQLPAAIDADLEADIDIEPGW